MIISDPFFEVGDLPMSRNVVVVVSRKKGGGADKVEDTKSVVMGKVWVWGLLHKHRYAGAWSFIKYYIFKIIPFR